MSSANKENTEPDNINVGLVATIAVVGALLVVSTAAAVTALVRSESNAYGNEVGAYSNLGSVRRLKEEQRAKLEAPPGWSDRSKGLVSMPIDRAMVSVAADIQKNPFFATLTPPKKDDDAGAAAPAGDAGATAPTTSATPEAPKTGERPKPQETPEAPAPKKGEPAKPAPQEAPKPAPEAPTETP